MLEKDYLSALIEKNKKVSGQPVSQPVKNRPNSDLQMTGVLKYNGGQIEDKAHRS